jgi:hypothetical protein
MTSCSPSLSLFTLILTDSVVALLDLLVWRPRVFFAV